MKVSRNQPPAPAPSYRSGYNGNFINSIRRPSLFPPVIFVVRNNLPPTVLLLMPVLSLQSHLSPSRPVLLEMEHQAAAGSGMFPIVWEDQSGARLKGEVFDVNNETFLRCDTLEGHPRMYRREVSRYTGAWGNPASPKGSSRCLIQMSMPSSCLSNTLNRRPCAFGYLPLSFTVCVWQLKNSNRRWSLQPGFAIVCTSRSDCTTLKPSVDAKCFGWPAHV
jgi:Gamma-glutamyl cyclotransferase, AIG2-like